MAIIWAWVVAGTVLILATFGALGLEVLNYLKRQKDSKDTESTPPRSKVGQQHSVFKQD